MITEISDYSETSEFYRIPAPIGAGDTAELTGLINFAEMRFTRIFGSVDFDIPSNLEALKYFVFSQWCAAMPIKKRLLHQVQSQDTTKLKMFMMLSVS